MDSNLVLKWKGDEHGTIDRARTRLVAKGYNQVERVDYFYTFAPTSSTTSNRLVAAMSCKLAPDLRHLDVDQAFIQSGLDAEMLLRLTAGCGRLSGKVVRLNKALHGLKRSGRSWHTLLLSILVKCGLEQCLVDLCVFRLMANDEVMAMLLVYVGGIKIAATEEITHSVVSGRFQQNIPYETSWRGYMVHG